MVSDRATVGIEALLWLMEIGALSRVEAVDITHSSSRAILRAAALART
jgi:hypothetical protein